MAFVTASDMFASTDSTARRTAEIGRDLTASIARSGTFWYRDWWDDRFMDLTIADPETRVQVFRFIDVLPALSSDSDIRRHLEEYLAEAGPSVPHLLTLPLDNLPRGPIGDAAIARLSRTLARRMAGRFIAGSSTSETLATVRRLRSRRLAFTADLLGEAVITECEAEQYAQNCLGLIENLAPALANEPEIRLTDRDDRERIPRANLSVKLTSLTPRFDALHAETTIDRVLARLRPLLHAARRLGAFVNIDMEQYAYKDLTHAIFRKALDEDESLRDWTDVGIVVQAYLPEAVGDLESLRDWARERGAPVSVRLVKGAYWDYEVTHARQVGWPVPVYTRKWESDANYERCSAFLIDNHHWLRPAFGSHNIRSLAHALALAEDRGLPREAIEVQVLHGMGGPIERAMVDRGYRVRVYTPFGAMLPGMAYLVRRLLENTSNESFLKASAGGGLSAEELLRDPVEVGAMWTRTRRSNRRDIPTGGRPGSTDDLPAFRNEPATDFAREAKRVAMSQALQEVRSATSWDGALVLGPVVGGQDVNSTGPTRKTLDPGDRARVISVVAMATPALARDAVTTARDAFPAWAATPPRERAGTLLRAAKILRDRRFELAAWEVYECAKTWREADADVAEAIDFCEFYAREMIRLAEPDDRDVPGETNRIEHIARGVAVVIPPWNFPLAIPCGMTVAALVTGNTVILKPAEQSPVMSWQLCRILWEAGVPREALAYLPGIGEEIGPTLVEHPDVSLIAFTGSKEVGLLINRQAADTKPGQDHVKRVIAEMGGKNAIIVDDDADLDEAVVGVLQSAFGYAGQKCSACSRAIVLEGIYDAFLTRLVEAAKTLPVGPADDPDTVVNPVIDTDARERIRKYAEIAEAEGRVVLQVNVGELAEKGNYVGPLIVADVSPGARIAQEEIFGPVLAVLKARDLDDSLRIAHSTSFALTGGLYSRSPANIAQVRREYRVGNLYINRPCTGALVNRQPFGGFKLSGIGTKAGGADYLREFLLTRVVTENTMRRGFTPEAEDTAHDRTGETSLL